MCRFIFAQAKIEYEDKRFDGEEWEEFKPNTPTGMLPVLEVDGEQLWGSGPVARYLAERLGLAGNNDVENAKIAGIVDMVDDFATKLITMLHEDDENWKAKLKSKLVDEDIPKFFGIGCARTIAPHVQMVGSMETSPPMLILLSTLLLNT